MTDKEKKLQLKRYKSYATGLFVLMAMVFIGTSFLEKKNPAEWIGYVKAFSEAAMVGALADWFAVTALFHYPLGLKIPHTNLIQNRKEQIGNNLGNFVVENFLSPKNIRPYIFKLKLSKFLGEWLSKNSNQDLLIKEASEIIIDLLQKANDNQVIHFISKKASEIGKDLKINKLIGNGLEYVVEKKDHQRVITKISEEVKKYILENRDMVRERVKKESFALIPKFVDDAIADKITSGIVNFFTEIEENPDNRIRKEITKKMKAFAKELKNNKKWEHEFDALKDNFLNEEKLHTYSKDIWESIKKTFLKELSEEHSPLKNYLKKNISELSNNLINDKALQHKIDDWIRVTVYKYVLKNTHQFGELISSTVGNWEGKELSNKLELEVGKDLQFIRINGTIVGGLVGLILYSISQLF